MVITHPLFPNGVGTPSYVMHVTVTLGWIVSGLGTPYTRQLLFAISTAIPVVPESWIRHVAEGLLRAERQGLFPAAQAAPKLATLRNYPILFDDETDAHAWSDTLDLARAHNLPVADAAYLELALRLKLPLATADAALTRAATSAGAPTFTP
jgi:predicted nucleic acid-binding protein